MSNRNKSKASIQMSKPELPLFLQRMKEQIVENDAIERKKQSDKKRKERPARDEDPDDNPTIVKLDDDDLSEEEYKRLKKDPKPSPSLVMKSPDLSKLISNSDSRTKESTSKKKLTYVSSSSSSDDE